MTRFIMVFIFISMVMVTQSSAGSLYQMRDNGGESSLINTSSEIESEFSTEEDFHKYMKGIQSPCRVKGIKTLCFKMDGNHVLSEPIPVLPSKILRIVQRSSNKSGKAVFNVGAFADIYIGAQLNVSLFDPIEHQWATSEFIVWKDAASDELATAVADMWTRLSLQSGDVGIDKNGRFLVSVDHPKKKFKSLQVCWMFFDKIDPESKKCTAVIVERNGKKYVRFIQGYFEGGYSLEPENVFGCNVALTFRKGRAGIQDIFADLAQKFSSSPFNLEISSQKASVNTGVLRLVRKYQTSELFPDFREIVDMRFLIERDGEKIQPDTGSWAPRSKPNYYEIEIAYSFAISKQNVGELPEMQNPSEEQTNYFDQKAIDFIEKKFPCKKGA